MGLAVEPGATAVKLAMAQMAVAVVLARGAQVVKMAVAAATQEIHQERREASWVEEVSEMAAELGRAMVVVVMAAVATAVEA